MNPIQKLTHKHLHNVQLIDSALYVFRECVWTKLWIGFYGSINGTELCIIAKEWKAHHSIRSVRPTIAMIVPFKLFGHKTHFLFYSSGVNWTNNIYISFFWNAKRWYNQQRAAANGSRSLCLKFFQFIFNTWISKNLFLPKISVNIHVCMACCGGVQAQ